MSRRPSSTRPPLARVCVLAAALAVTVGCSLKTMAVKTVANTLSDTGDVFTRDDDPELVRDATPFALKLYESLLESVPNARAAAHLHLRQLHAVRLRVRRSRGRWARRQPPQRSDGAARARAQALSARTRLLPAGAGRALRQGHERGAAAGSRHGRRQGPQRRRAAALLDGGVVGRRDLARASTGRISPSTFRPCGRWPIARWRSIRDGARARSTS